MPIKFIHLMYHILVAITSTIRVKLHKKKQCEMFSRWDEYRTKVNSGQDEIPPNEGQGEEMFKIIISRKPKNIH